MSITEADHHLHNDENLDDLHRSSDFLEEDPDTTTEANNQLPKDDKTSYDFQSSSDIINASNYSNLLKDLKEFYSSMQDFVVKEEFRTHIQKDCSDMNKIDEKMRLQENDIMRTECPIVFAGETSSGKSSIINLILGEQILPTQITSSSQKVCTIKYCERCMISTRDSKNEELDNIHFENFKEMAKQLELISDTDYAEVAYVDIYMPISWLRGNVTIIDTSGFGDFEQRNVAEEMVCCPPTAFAFVLVVDISNAGGLLKEKLNRFLSKVKHSVDRMIGIGPGDVIILLNKWDALLDEDMEKQELLFKAMKTCFSKMWMELDESCIFKISARQVSKEKTKCTGDFDMFQITLKKVIARNMKKRINVHIRFLNIFLDECKSVLTTKLQCANKKAEENRKLLQRLSKDLENIEKTRKKVISNIDRNINSFLAEASFKLHEYLHHPKFRAAVLRDADHFTRISIGGVLDTRIENETKAWQEKHIEGIFRETCMADLIEKSENIQRTLHEITDNLKGLQTPFDVDNKIPIALALGVIPGGAGLISSFMLKRIISHPGVLVGIVAGGILSGLFFTSLVAFEVADDFETVLSNAFQARINAITMKEVRRTLREQYLERIETKLKAFIEGDLEKEIIKIKEIIITLKNDQENFEANKESLFSLQSTVIKKLERLQHIGRIDITLE